MALKVWRIDMKNVVKVIDWIVDKSIYLGCTAVVLMMMTTVVDVVLRFFKHPLKGSMEITTALMVCVVFFGMGRCSLLDLHMKVDIFKKFPWLDKVNKLITTALCLIICWQTIIQAFKAQSLNSVSQLLRIPKYPFVFVAAYGFLIIAAALISEFIHNIISRKQHGGDA